MSKLQSYVDNLFTSFSTNRQKTLEPSWTDARNAFNRIVDSTKHWKSGEAENWRSDAYLGTTRQKIVAGAAIVTDTMLQGGRINYLLEVSPDDKEALEIAGFPSDFHEDNKEKMRARIDTQLGWGKADQALRKAILSGALYGEAFSRIILDEHTKSTFKQIQDTVLPDAPEVLRYAFSKEEMTYPKIEHLNIWDCFTDLENRDPRTNLGFFYRTYTRKAEIKKLLTSDEPGIIKSNIKKVMDASDEATPDSTATTNPKLEDLNTTFNNLRILDFYGMAKVNDVRSFLKSHAPELLEEFDIPDEDEYDCEEIEVQIVLAGTSNHIVKISPIDETFGRPIFYVPWEDDVDDTLKATGIADNCMNTQHLLNGVFRALVDNQKLSGNAMLGIKEEHLMERLDDITPGKAIRISPECPDIRQALQNFQIQDVSPGLIGVFRVVAEMLEEDSNIPRVQQGIESRRDETAFSMAQRLEKSGKYFGQVIRNYDDGWTEPSIQYMYYYNMLDPDMTEGKGDYEVQALGFSSFQNRVTRLNGLRQFFEIALSHPELFERLKLESLFREFARMLDLDPEQVTFDEEEVAAREEQKAIEAQRQAELAELDKGQKEAAIARDQSQAQINTVHANKANEELKLEQAEALSKLTNPPTE